MSLSISKLENLLTRKGLTITKIFCIDNYCVYIELLCNSTADVCMLYIPSKYNITAPQSENVWVLQYLDVDENGDIPETYAEEQDNFDLEQKYNEVELDFNSKQKNIENHLEESYKHNVSLKDIGKNDKTHLREIFRQLRRLKFCVQNIKYKLCIVYNSYLCCIRRDGTYECFFVTGQQFPSKNRKLIVTLDLETLYAKIDSVIIDVKTIREGVYKVLDKNQTKHSHSLINILEFKNTLIQSIEDYVKKKEKYTQYITKFEKLYQDITRAEKDSVEKLCQIEKKYESDSSIKGLHSDIEKSHLKAKHQTELDNIIRLKQEIINNILDIKLQWETIALQTDKICFDNIVMLDTVRKNFELLSEI